MHYHYTNRLFKCTHEGLEPSPKDCKSKMLPITPMAQKAGHTRFELVLTDRQSVVLPDYTNAPNHVFLRDNLRTTTYIYLLLFLVHLKIVLL